MKNTIPAISLVALLLLPAVAHAQESTPTQLPPAWQAAFDKLTFYGDSRVRMEGDWNRPGAEDRWRSRLRVRLGANYSVSEELLVGARITTGNPNDSRDTNATLGGGSSSGFDKFGLNLDRLFMSWRPADYDPFFLTVGKFAHPFQRNPVYEELVWYSEVQPEGAALGTQWRDVGPLDALRAQAGFYVFQEDTRGDVNIALAELVASSTLSKSSRGDLSAAWYGYTNPDAVSAATVEDYSVLDVIAALTIDGERAPWKFALEGISNLDASTSEDTGWAVGCSYGQTREKGDWKAYYQYQEVGNDAVFSPVANGDFLMDHNFRGHVANVDYALSSASMLRLRVLQATPLDPALSGGFDEDSLRIRLEFNVKF